MPFDIVTHGLNDQIFKYNNELGQAEGFLDDVVMNYLIDVGKCIMKDDNRLPSSNNIQDMNYILKKFNIDMKHVRLLCLLYPWMSSLTVDQNNIDEIKQFEKMLKNFISDVKRDMNLVGQLNLADSFIKLNEKDIDIFEYFRKIKKQIHHALCDCIDTSSAMDLLRQLIDTTIKYFYESHENVNVHSLENILEFIFKLLHIFGLNYD
jgi:cysteinyl-tRNA synthetase